MSNPPPISDNPFTRVYDAVWNSLFDPAGSNPLPMLVKAGNRINYNTREINPMKASRASADESELLLVDEGGQANLHANSSGSSYTQYISLYASTGTWTYGIVSALNWYVMCNLVKFQTNINGVTWNRNHPVKQIEMIPVQTITNNPLVPKSLAGFTLVWRLQLGLRFPFGDLTYIEERT